MFFIPIRNPVRMISKPIRNAAAASSRVHPRELPTTPIRATAETRMSFLESAALARRAGLLDRRASRNCAWSCSSIEILALTRLQEKNVPAAGFASEFQGGAGRGSVCSMAFVGRKIHILRARRGSAFPLETFIQQPMRRQSQSGPHHASLPGRACQLLCHGLGHR